MGEMPEFGGEKMWFWLSLTALIFWSGSDLFSKIGCQDSSDRYSHLKMVSAVGIVMGLHAGWQILFGGVALTGQVLLTYLPVSLLYILSMALGYFGLRFIELSISCPICNSFGAVAAILIFAFGGLAGTSAVELIAVALVCAGVVLLGAVESREDAEERKHRQELAGRTYPKTWLALAIPLMYCLLDALGTFADSRVLMVLDEDAANTAYELTFLITGLVCAIYVRLIKHEKFQLRKGLPRYLGALCETAGQYAYVYALADTEHAAPAAAIISSYCAATVVWGRVFLKEKLTWKHYACIALIVIGITALGFFDG